MTGFLRANRDGAGDSDIDDTFTIVLQYGGDKRNLLVQVKTAIVSAVQDQFKFFVRGTAGSYLKVRNSARLQLSSLFLRATYQEPVAGTTGGLPSGSHKLY